MNQVGELVGDIATARIVSAWGVVVDLPLFALTLR